MAEVWLIIALTTILTFGTRLSFIFLHGLWQPPELFQRALRFVPPAVLSAIILPEMLIVNQRFFFSLTNPRLIAGIVAMLVAWRTRRSFLTIAIGMLALYLAQLVIR